MKLLPNKPVRGLSLYEKTYKEMGRIWTESIHHLNYFLNVKVFVEKVNVILLLFLQPI